MNEISDRIPECRRAQDFLLDALDRMSAIYREVFQTMEETTWWEGETKRQFLDILKIQEDKVDEIRQEITKESDFYDKWDHHINEIDGVFRQVPNEIKSAMGLFGDKQSDKYGEWMRNNESDLPSFAEAKRSFFNSMGVLDEHSSAIARECAKRTKETLKRIKEVQDRIEKKRESFDKWKEENRKSLEQTRKQIQKIEEDSRKNQQIFTEEEQKILLQLDSKSKESKKAATSRESEK